MWFSWLNGGYDSHDWISISGHFTMKVKVNVTTLMNIWVVYAVNYLFAEVLWHICSADIIIWCSNVTLKFYFAGRKKAEIWHIISTHWIAAVYTASTMTCLCWEYTLCILGSAGQVSCMAVILTAYLSLQQGKELNGFINVLPKIISRCV